MPKKTKASPLMRAKLQVETVNPQSDGNGTIGEEVVMNAVCGDKPFGSNGESEDNTYARFTPSAKLNMTIANSELFGKLAPGQRFYVDFTPAS